MDNCLVCSANNLCITCTFGYSLVPNVNSSVPITSQCVVCLDPCNTCNADSSCNSCLSPYIFSATDNSCFLCDDPRCTSCTATATGVCSTCQTGWFVSNNACVKCIPGCTSCTSATTCTACSPLFYFLSNNSCTVCPNAPACKTCMMNTTTNTTVCMSCEVGYYLMNGTCQHCQTFCEVCINGTYCTKPISTFGVTLVETMVGMNTIAACDLGCNNCSKANPLICTQCFLGFYMVPNSSPAYCRPCSANQCMDCLDTNPALCLSCFAGYFLNTTSNICQQCSFPCASCTSNSATTCSSCVQGWVYITSNNTCMLAADVTNSVENCANQQLTGTTPSCSLCLQGYTLTPAGCVPCQDGCLVCNPIDLTVCSKCEGSYTLNASNVCVADSTATACTDGCDNCVSGVGCVGCMNGWVLNHNFQCIRPCINPCATCSPTNEFSCLSCVLGYTLSGTSCVADTACNTNANCITCPVTFMLTTASNTLKLNQTCTTCASGSNCQRCMSSNTSMCTACPLRFYLADNNSCIACPTNCIFCFSATFCFACENGFIALSAGTLDGEAVLTNSNCSACTSPCSTCEGSPTTCTSCVSGFTLNSDICLSNFNYLVTVSFGVSLAVFQENYLSFLNAVATAAGVRVSEIAILSITNGSVNVNMAVTSTAAAGSNDAINTENAIKTAVGQGQSFGNMTVQTASVTTQGGSNSNDSSSGLSTTAIILLAVLIPVGVLSTNIVM